MKLAADGIRLSQQNACELALVVDPRDTDLSQEITRKSYLSPKALLMHNPFAVDKRKKKKKKRR